tara:strand:+ start:3107 stop:4048 length:942 start_codon:yes stop_codon:yes gene_type:complete
MPVVLGRNSFIKLGEESSWGAGGASTPVSNRIISTSLQRKQERNQTTFLSTSAAAFSEGFFDGMELTGGTIELPVYYEGTGMLIKAAVGSVSSSAGPAPYTHTYTPITALPSLEIQLQRGNSQVENFEGCIISSMALSVEAGGEMTASFDIVAETATTRSGSVSPSFGDGRQVLHYEAGQLNFNAVNYSLRSLEFTLDNKIDRRNLLGSKLTAEPLITDIREVTLSTTLDLEDNNLYNAQIVGTQGTVDITFTNSDGDTFRLRLYNAVVIDYDDSINTVGRIERTCTWQGLSGGGNPAFDIVIVNQDASGIAN